MIGAMSGTSADGVDVAIVRVKGHGLAMTAELLFHRHQAYDAELRKAIFQLRESGQVDLASLANVGRLITLAYARAVGDILLATSIPASAIAAIAAHGQTLFHAPPLTIQWFDPSLLAWETGCAVVSDFRRADCAAGGQGAPLVPFADYLLFRHTARDRVLLNIGGIANLTYLRANGSLEDVIAFDTGPGNCISDWICREHGPHGLSWDVDGGGASRGKVLVDVAERFLAYPYFKAPPPKSTDGPAMVSAFGQALGSTKADTNDLLATAVDVTSAAIAAAIGNLPCRDLGALELIVSGGGIHNKALMGWLHAKLAAGTIVRSTDDFAVRSDAKEAVAFALLGAATLDGVASNVPSVTGAKRAAVLGSVTPRV